MSQALYFFGLFIVIVVTCAKSQLSVLDCLRTWLVVEERTKDEEGLDDEARHLWGQTIIFGNRIYLFSKYIQHFAFCHEDWVI